MASLPAGTVVRVAVPADAATISQVRVAAWQAGYRDLMPAEVLAALDPQAQLDRLRERLQAQSIEFRMLVVEWDGRIIAQATFGKPRFAASPRMTELWALNVHPDHWGQGIAQLLLVTVAEQARRDGASDLVLWCLEGNRRARRSYERAGWLPGGMSRTSDHLIGSPLTEVSLQLSLA